MARTGARFPTVRSEGSLLPPDLIDRIDKTEPDLGGFNSVDYGLEGSERLREVISRDWHDAQTYWTAFQTARHRLAEEASGVSETRELWLLQLLKVLGYQPEFRAAAEELNGRRYVIQHRDAVVPLHLVSFRQKIDTAVRSGEGQVRISAHALLQEYINANGEVLYGLVSNGLVLRLLRDSHSLTRLTYLEFDLEGMFEGAVYPDFVLLWLVVHRSRLPRSAEGATDCWLERWREKAETQGARALGELRKGVEEALKHLGSGLLEHPANDALRQRLDSGELNSEGFYSQLLRLLYRILFLFVAEERGLLFPPGTPSALLSTYASYYSVNHLRDIASRQRDDNRHDDLWRVLTTVFAVLSGQRTGIGLPSLGGLFSLDSCPDIEGVSLSNDRLSKAILELSWVRLRKGFRRVNYRDIGAEELGGVYEGLLELHPDVDPIVRSFDFSQGMGDQRKKSGSYYTPTSLVDELVKSALEPVIADRLTGATSQEAREQALLDISVCDSATGSGHFLIAAADRLARELAGIRAGDREPGPEISRQAVRDVIRHCIYGVDMNPLAVDLCRVSLWLEGHDAGKPLTFLDQHIRLGNSLVGATPDLVGAGIPDAAFEPLSVDVKSVATGVKKKNREATAGQRSFDQAASDWKQVIQGMGDEARNIADMPEDEAAQVEAQSMRYQRHRLEQVEPARAALDVWTAAFFWPLTTEAPEPPLTSALRVPLGKPPALSPQQWREVERLRAQIAFFHWPLEFPDVFDKGGFDCVLGNPPWERIKLQELEFFAERDKTIAKAPKAARQELIKELPRTDPILHQAFVQALRASEGQSKFVRASERFSLTAVGDVNLYALFAEHDRALLNHRGRAGVIVPTGIATDDSTKRFFQDLTDHRALATLFDFENRQGFFPDVDSRMKFCTLTMSGAPLPQGDLAFFLTSTDQLRDEQRRFQLSAEDFALLNPNTHTCPVFRTKVDAELTRAIYRRVPVLIDKAINSNPWNVRLRTMFHVSNDGHLFRTRAQLESEGFVYGGGAFHRGNETYLPLYEGRLGHQYNHRFASEPAGHLQASTDKDLRDPKFRIEPESWAPEDAYREWILRHEWSCTSALLGFRRVARNTDERTVIASLLPWGPATYGWILSVGPDCKGLALLLGNWNSMIVDYVMRSALSQPSIPQSTFEQLPVLPPSAYTETDVEFVIARVLELTYTAWDMQPFARELGYDGEPFDWDADRRALLRADLDAFYASRYGLARDELRYVLDPTEVYGPDFPGETFRVLKESEEDDRVFGEYRTRRLILEAWDRLGLEPRNRDGRYEVEAGPVVVLSARIPSIGNAKRQSTARVPTAMSKLPSQQSLLLSPLEELAATRAEPDGGARGRALQRGLTLLAERGPLTARDLEAFIGDPAVNTHIINSVLCNEGKDRVARDSATSTYRLRQSATDRP